MNGFIGMRRALLVLVVGVLHAYAGPLILKANLSYEPYIIKSSNEFAVAVSLDTKFTIDFNTVISPYIGVTLAVGDAIYYSGNIGVEKAFIYNNGFSITPSLGIHVGECGIDVVGYRLIGARAIVDFAFSQKRFTPYLTVGTRYTYVFDTRGQWSFPLGAGLSLKI